MKPPRKKFSPKTYAEIVLRQGGRCACGCREKFVAGERIEFDHELDLQWGGEDTPENLRALKPKHHLRKTVRALKERAKVERIRSRGGMLKKRPSARDKAFQKMVFGDRA